MPALNAADSIRASVLSLVRQTHADWELVLIDDGSVDGTADVARAAGDGRVRVVRHQSPEGIAKSLNDGLAVAEGRYIARLDADDLAESTRLERQVQYLKGRPDLHAVASAVRFIDDRGYPMISPPLEDVVDKETARRLILLTNPFEHPSVCFARRAFDDGARYPTNQHIEDRALWIQQRRAWNWEVIPVRLTRRRLHTGNYSSSHPSSAVDSLAELLVGEMALEGFELSRATARELLSPGVDNGGPSLREATYVFNTIEAELLRSSRSRTARRMLAHWRMRALLPALRTTPSEVRALHGGVDTFGALSMVRSLGAGLIRRAQRQVVETAPGTVRSSE